MLKILKLFFCVFFLFLSTQSYGSFQIVEVFPNTIDDKNLEYVIVQNISGEAQSLSGYTLSDKVKGYIISTDEILDIWEKQIFLRWETKLILNNSNEEIFLSWPEWDGIDSVSYKNTIKWEALFFEPREHSIEIPNLIISDEVFISWEVLISEEVRIADYPETRVEADTWLQLKDENLLAAPDVVIWFQRPSYVELTGTWNVYTCDSSRDECKVNFDLRSSFSDWVPERDYRCEIDFGLAELSWQEWRCNPNTVIFSEWRYEVIFKIYHEDDETVFSQQSILIQNIPVQEKEHEIIQENVQKIISQSLFTDLEDEIVQEVDITMPEVVFWLQRPSYIEHAGTWNIYVCDSSRDECKVNFDLRDSFTENISMSEYSCEIDFWVAWISFWEEEKCNPNTVTFPVWRYEVQFQIIHKEFPENISEKTIFIEHTLLTQNITNLQSKPLWNQSSASSISRIQVGTSKFIVQSWLSWEWYEYYCVKDTCKINLKYEPKYKQEKCFWDFAWGSYSHPKTQHKCNPSYVEIPAWVHKLSLKVYDSNYEDNYIIFPFTVYPKSEDIALLTEQDIQENLELSDELWEWNISQKTQKISIELQWKISKEKTLSWSVLRCSWVEKCYVNLEWIVIGWGEEKYSWMLDGEEFSQNMNPKWIWLEWEWIHEITFIVGDSQAAFQVHIVASSLPLGEDWMRSAESEVEKQAQDTKIKFTQNFLALKYDGLRISWLAPVASKVEIYNAWEKILSWVSDEKGKYRIVSKSFSAWDYIFSTKITLISGEEIFLEDSGEFTLLSDKRANWFLVKKSSTKTSSLKSSTKVTPKLVLKQSDAYIPEEIEILSIRQRIILIAGLLFFWICMLLHMISKTHRIISSQLLSIYLQQFSIKQRITLILP